MKHEIRPSVAGTDAAGGLAEGAAAQHQFAGQTAVASSSASAQSPSRKTIPAQTGGIRIVWTRGCVLLRPVTVAPGEAPGRIVRWLAWIEPRHAEQVLPALQTVTSEVPRQEAARETLRAILPGRVAMELKPSTAATLGRFGDGGNVRSLSAQPHTPVPN